MSQESSHLLQEDYSEQNQGDLFQNNGGDGDDQEMEEVSEQDSIISDDNKKTDTKELQEESSDFSQVNQMSAQPEESKISVQSKQSKAKASCGESDDSKAKRSQKSPRKHSQKKDKKKKKKDKKKKDKKKKDKKKKDKKKKKKRRNTSSSSSESSTDDGLDDSKVDYGSPERISDGSEMWEGRSDELYDSDTPESPTNEYHKKAKPRCLEVVGENDDHLTVRLILDFLVIEEREENLCQKPREKWTYHDKKREEEYQANYVNHKEYQSREIHGEPIPVILNNLISQDFIRGVSKDLTCPICQQRLAKPVIYKGCLHRFCSCCIEAYNRQGKKECPCCRKVITTRRELRGDKNIAAMMETLEEEFEKLMKQEELENLEITRKIIADQKQLKEKKDKQKKIYANEFRRKYGDTRMSVKEQSTNSQLQNRARKAGQSAGFGGAEGLDLHHIIRLIEEKKAHLSNILLAVDCEVVIHLDKEQGEQQRMMVKKIRLKTNRLITLIHLGILVAHKNGNKEEEWPNYEFYPMAQNKRYEQSEMDNPRPYIRPFRFKATIQEIIKDEFPGEENQITYLEIVYKKKQLPSMNPRFTQPLKVGMEQHLQGVVGTVGNGYTGLTFNENNNGGLVIKTEGSSFQAGSMQDSFQFQVLMQQQGYIKKNKFVELYQREAEKYSFSELQERMKKGYDVYGNLRQKINGKYTSKMDLLICKLCVKQLRNENTGETYRQLNDENHLEIIDSIEKQAFQITPTINSHLKTRHQINYNCTQMPSTLKKKNFFEKLAFYDMFRDKFNLPKQKKIRFSEELFYPDNSLFSDYQQEQGSRMGINFNPRESESFALAQENQFMTREKLLDSFESIHERNEDEELSPNQIALTIQNYNDESYLQNQERKNNQQLLSSSEREQQWSLNQKLCVQESEDIIQNLDLRDLLRTLKSLSFEQISFFKSDWCIRYLHGTCERQDCIYAHSENELNLIEKVVEYTEKLKTSALNIKELQNQSTKILHKF